MSEYSIPHLSRDDIELKAEEVNEYFFKEVLDEPKSTPILEMVNILTDKFNIIFDFTNNLGYSKNGNKILGRFTFNPLGIYTDEILLDSSRFKFALAHEIGHLILHRKIKTNKIKYDIFEDSEKDLITWKKILISDRDWIEWQANQFASAYLMPRKTSKNAVINIQNEMDINKNLGTIYLDKNSYSYKDFKEIIKRLNQIYLVNQTNLEYRLKDLGILEDHRMKDVKHITQLFMQE